MSYFSSFAKCLIVHFALFFAIAFLTRCKPKSEEPVNYNNDPRIMAISFLQKNRFDEAETAFLKAIKLDPANTLNYADLSLLYLAKKSYDKTEKQIQAGLKIQPDNTGLLLILSELYIQKGEPDKAMTELHSILAIDPKNPPAVYKLAMLSAAKKDYSAQKSYLLKLSDLLPANIVPRLQLAEMLAQEGKSDSSLSFLQSVKKIVPEFNSVMDVEYKKAVTFITGNQNSNAVLEIQKLQKILQLTHAYAIGFDEIDQPKLLTGYSEFNDSKFSQVYDKNRIVTLNDIRFTDASAAVGLTIPGIANASFSTLALADDDGKGNTYVFAGLLPKDASTSKHYLFVGEMGNFRDITTTVDLGYDAIDLDATFSDYDNDGYRDLLISTSKGIFIFRNNGDGTFERIKQKTGLENINDGKKMLVADFDQDGDLDIYVACKTANKFFRNNNDGTFTENAGAMNLSAVGSGTIDMDYADWDADGDLDIAIVTGEGKIQLYNNNRHSKFENVTDASELQLPVYGGTAIAFGDYNNDGYPDLFIAGDKTRQPVLLKNKGGQKFEADKVSQLFVSSLQGITMHSVTFIDFDNDGYEDILVAGVSENNSAKGVQLFHNKTAKGFENATNLLPASLTGGYKIDIGDFNIDGDDDLFISTPSGVNLIRNDGGNLNHYLQLQLTGLSYGSNKNNRFGIGAQVELKAGDLYQTKTIRRTLTNFGVGSQDSLDVVRIIWPNGTPQIVGDPSRWQRTLEEEKLKGSCPFLFVWNGERYEFFKDMMWRSALGMPLSVRGTDTTYA
ncbi:MAG: VCBS repeat-containing protein, partial [Bacteroidetes bacterium]|nr:VCBS repeat-containing protein [Bacteroidota bacterium]